MRLPIYVSLGHSLHRLLYTYCLNTRQPCLLPVSLGNTVFFNVGSLILLLCRGSHQLHGEGLPGAQGDAVPPEGRGETDDVAVLHHPVQQETLRAEDHSADLLLALRRSSGEDVNARQTTRRCSLFLH